MGAAKGQSEVEARTECLKFNLMGVPVILVRRIDGLYHCIIYQNYLETVCAVEECGAEIIDVFDKIPREKSGKISNVLTYKEILQTPSFIKKLDSAWKFAQTTEYRYFLWDDKIFITETGAHTGYNKDVIR